MSHAALVTRGSIEKYDKLFENQCVLDEGKLTGYAKAVGLGVVKFNGYLANDGHKGRVDANIRDGRKAGYFQVSSEHGMLYRLQ